MALSVDEARMESACLGGEYYAVARRRITGVPRTLDLSGHAGDGGRGRKEGAMRLERTEFGSVTIDGQTYEHDVVIRLSGEIVKRKKKLSKQKYGTSHKIAREEAEFVYEEGCEELIVGTGQYDTVVLSNGARSFFEEKGCKVVALATPDALRAYNSSSKRKIALLHVTC